MRTQEEQIQEMDAETSIAYWKQFWKAALAALISGVLWLSSAEWSNSVYGFILIFGLGAAVGGVAYLAGAAWVLLFLRVYSRLPTVYIYQFRRVSERDTWILVAALMGMVVLAIAFALSAWALFFDWGLAWAFGSPMMGQLIGAIVYAIDFVNDTIDDGKEDCCF